ncbi:MAG: HAD-IIB family hydrolase [Clostridia bacterium]|nr:HAD-IIB family hydrolase [Clostridia bacterium]
MRYDGIKAVAFDLDGTLSQHKQPLPPENLAALLALAERYRLVMVGAGNVRRIFRQMGSFPIDVIGNYGMQYARYNEKTRDLDTVRDESVPCDRERVEAIVTDLRARYGFTEFRGDTVEFHDSGCITFPILGTAALLEDKLAFDPDRKKRRAIYSEVVAAFPDYHVFVGGSSSFDMAPRPYNKYYALDLYAREHGFSHSEVAFVGDDYGLGGNDESVYLSDFPFLCVDNYLDFPRIVAPLLG